MTASRHRLIWSDQFVPNYLLLGGILSLIYLALFVFQARVDIEVEGDFSQSTFFRLYWAGPDQGFSEKRMAYAALEPGRDRYRFYLGSLANIERIRIDPLERAGKLRLNTITISQWGWQTLQLQQLSDYGFYRANDQIAVAAAEPGLMISTRGEDGHFEISIDPRRVLSFPARPLLVVGGLWLALGLFMLLLTPLVRNLRFVPVLLLTSWGLVLLMAQYTGLDLHPDEVVHLEAVKYYASHWLPPALDSPEIASSYSIYGHTRLAVYEIYYPLAGYFQAIPRLLDASPLAGARSFGLLILGLLVLFSFFRTSFRPFALPLLVSAQAWYLFSYTNSDGFALALSLWLAYQAASPDSLLSRFLLEPGSRTPWLTAIGLGLALGCLPLLKLNYYFFILFLLLYLGWRLAMGGFPNRPLLLRRLAILGLIGLAVFALRFALDIHANGWNSEQLQLRMQEQYAAAEFKPGTPLEDQQSMIRLRDRGYSAAYVLDRARWFEKSFQSAFGVYGFSRFYADQKWYQLVRYLGLALLVVLILAALGSRQQGNHWLLAIVAICAAGLILTSAWHSWTAAFQPQGRYLMPILPMLAVLLWHLQAHRLHRLGLWLVVLLFVLAAYSFVEVGLVKMGVLVL